MSKKQTGAQRMRPKIKATAERLHRAGIVGAATFAKVTAREVDCAHPPTQAKPVFARFLNGAISTLSQWERDEKRPRGAAARLLAIVKQKGVAVVL